MRGSRARRLILPQRCKKLGTLCNGMDQRRKLWQGVHEHDGSSICSESFCARSALPRAAVPSIDKDARCRTRCDCRTQRDTSRHCWSLTRLEWECIGGAGRYASARRTRATAADTPELSRLRLKGYLAEYVLCLFSPEVMLTSLEPETWTNASCRGLCSPDPVAG